MQNMQMRKRHRHRPELVGTTVQHCPLLNTLKKMPLEELPETSGSKINNGNKAATVKLLNTQQ